MNPPKVPNDEQIRETLGEVGDALQRALVLSSERIQSVFEDAVVRGRMTRRDAEELASSLVAAGRDQAAELQSEFDGLIVNLPPVIADAVDAVDPRGAKRRKEAAPAEPATAAQTEAVKLADAGAPKAAPRPAAKKPVAKKPTPPKPAAKKPAAKKPAATSAAAKPAATAAKAPVAKKPTPPKPAAKKPAAKPAAKKPAAKPATTKPKPAPAPTTAAKATAAAPAKQAAGPTPSAAPNAATASVRELMTAIPKLTKTELSELRTQEAAGKNRKTVLDAINKKLA